MANTTSMRTALLALLTAMSLAACGSSSGPTATQVPGDNVASTPQTTATTTTTSTTTASPAGGACRAAGLSLAFLGQQGATGHGELGFELRNTGAQSCHTFGYPGIQFLGRSSAPLPTVGARTTHDFAGTIPLRVLTVAPGGSVSFRVGVTHFGSAGSGAGCTTAYALQVIPPDDTARLIVAIPEGAYECQAATISPLSPGTSAYP